MKSLLFALLLSLSVSAQYANEMRYLKGNQVLFDDKVIKTVGGLKPIILEKNSPELAAAFKKYRLTRFAQQAAARLREFGFGYGVVNVLGRQYVQPLPLAIGTAGVGGAELLRGPSNRSLKQLVEMYNDHLLIERIQIEKQLNTNSNQ